MRAYIIRRLLLLVPTLLLVSIIVFFISRLIPGNVVDIMMAEQQWVTERTRPELEQALGLDAPIHVQYIRWIGDVLHGDLGKSLWSERRVVDELRLRWPVTVELGLMGIIIGLTTRWPEGGE